MINPCYPKISSGCRSACCIRTIRSELLRKASHPYSDLAVYWRCSTGLAKTSSPAMQSVVPVRSNLLWSVAHLFHYSGGDAHCCFLFLQSVAASAKVDVWYPIMCTDYWCSFWILILTIISFRKEGEWNIIQPFSQPTSPPLAGTIYLKTDQYRVRN